MGRHVVWRFPDGDYEFWTVKDPALDQPLTLRIGEQEVFQSVVKEHGVKTTHQTWYYRSSDEEVTEWDSANGSPISKGEAVKVVLDEIGELETWQTCEGLDRTSREQLSAVIEKCCGGKDE